MVLDVWSIFMEKAGWKEGEPLVGSKKIARSEILEKLLNDGEGFENTAVMMNAGLAEIGYRAAFSTRSLSASV